ncbi:MAG: hypothetical protein ACYC6Y_13915 [Thermoguttaceae bacterium]
MIERSDVNAFKVGLVGIMGAIIATVVALVAIVLYFHAAGRIERARSQEAALRICRQVQRIRSGNPVAQSWLNADFQRATQDAQLGQSARRIIKQEDGSQQTACAVPIRQAMESVLEEAAGARTEGGNPKEAGT